VNRRLGLACLAAFAMAAPSVKADVITTLFNTGVDAAGNQLGGGMVDPHWSITVNPSGTGSSAYTTVADGFPLPGTWVDNPSSAAWIQPTSGTAPTHAAGTYTYTTTFSLAGFDPTTAEISFRAAADDRISGVFLNGNNVGFTYDAPAFTAFSDQFTVSNPAFFQDGINQLQFQVVNDPLDPDCYDPKNPSGLLVKIKGCAIPEPSTFALVGAGLGLFAFRRLRKRTV
jgi:hypothetical protein